MAYQGGPSLPQPPGFAPRPQLRIEVIGEAWPYFKQQAGNWIAAIVVSAIIVIGVDAAIGVVLRGSTSGAIRAAGPNAGAGILAFLPALLGARMLGNLAGSIVAFFFHCGLARMACKQIRGEAISLADVFSVTDVIGAVALGAILYSLCLYVGLFACCIGIVVPYTLLFLMPYLVGDQRMSATDALSSSARLVSSVFPMALLYLIVIALFNIGGFCALLVGVLVTAPMSVIATALLYRDLFPQAFQNYPVPGFGTGPYANPYGSPPTSPYAQPPRGMPAQGEYQAPQAPGAFPQPPGGFPQPPSSPGQYPQPPSTPPGPPSAGPPPEEPKP